MPQLENCSLYPLLSLVWPSVHQRGGHPGHDSYLPSLSSGAPRTHADRYPRTFQIINEMLIYFYILDAHAHGAIKLQSRNGAANTSSAPRTLRHAIRQCMTHDTGGENQVPIPSLAESEQRGSVTCPESRTPRDTAATHQIRSHLGTFTASSETSDLLKYARDSCRLETTFYTRVLSQSITI